MSAAHMRDLPHGRLVRTCGLVTMRQQPQTANGVVCVTLEDETGSTNVIVWKRLKDKQRPELFARALRGAKRELDPKGMMNPGVLIDP